MGRQSEDGTAQSGPKAVDAESAHVSELALLDLAEGRISLGHRKRVVAHLETCERCKAALEEMTRRVAANAGTDEEGNPGGVPVQLEKTHVPERPRSAEDPLIGEKLGEYVVLAAMSRGGMGMVYRGEQPVIGKPVAIKVLLPHVAHDPEQVQRLLAEARAVNAIRHPNIVDIFSFGQLVDGRHYFVMELLDGEPLNEALHRNGPYTPHQTITLLSQALAALDAAHAAGIIHRDLKPENMFLTTLPDGTWRVKLLDFGIAKVSGGRSGTSPNLVMGTPGYMAPEQLRGENVVPQTDLFAIGVIAYKLLTGRDAFEGETLTDLMERTLVDAPPPITQFAPATPPALQRLILQLLEKEPDQRPATAAAVRVELVRIARDLGGTMSNIAVPTGALSGSRIAQPAATKFVDRAQLPKPEPQATLVVQPNESVAAPEAPSRRGPGKALYAAGAVLVAVLVAGGVWLAGSDDAAAQTDAQVVPPQPLTSAPPQPVVVAPPVEPVKPPPPTEPEEPIAAVAPPVEKPVSPPRPPVEKERLVRGPSRADVARRIESARAKGGALPTAGIRRIVARELQLLDDRLRAGEAPAQVASDLEKLGKSYGL